MNLSTAIDELKKIIEKTGDCEILGLQIHLADKHINYDLMNQKQILVEGSLYKKEPSDYSFDDLWIP